MKHHHNLLILFLFIFCLLPYTLFAQKRVQYLQYEDLKLYHFGFLIGTHTQDLILEHSGAMDDDGNKWYGNVPSYAPGFSVGVLGDLRLTDFLSLRTSPTIHFGSKRVALASDNPTLDILWSEIRSNYLMIPLNVRYRGARTNNYRPYLMGGVSAGIDMGRDKREPILLSSIHPYLELGVGCDLYLPYFRLVPELKVCLGLNDVLVHDRTDQDSEAFLRYTRAFDRITSRLVVFSLQFE
jgi:Outer membrane protein beta-barrel domain